MKKLSKIKLQDAVVLENREMKMIYGGSGGMGGSGVFSFHCKCLNGVGEWYGNYEFEMDFVDAIERYCGQASNGYCETGNFVV